MRRSNQRKPNDITEAMKLAIHKRDSWKCARCGKATDLTLQHRQNRQMGGLGSKAPALGYFDGLTLCWSCNVLIEQSADLAVEAIMSGWKVPKNTPLPPRVIPVYYQWQRSWHFLLDDGRLDRCDATVAEALCREVYEWTS